MITLLIFLIGICIGSFINVAIDRIPHGKSIVYGRSQCDFCKHQLAWYDLVPIFSYLFLLGKCRYCHKKLSLQYPVVELLVGLLAVFIYLFQQPMTLNDFAVYTLDTALFVVAFALTIMDIKYHILSDILLITFGGFLFIKFLFEDPGSLLLRLGFGLLAALPILALYVFTKGRGMGFGDVKLVFLLGFLLGFPMSFVMYYVAFLTGAVWGVILILSGKKSLKGSAIAFGPFLFLGAFIALIWGYTVWHYLLTFFGV